MQPAIQRLIRRAARRIVAEHRARTQAQQETTHERGSRNDHRPAEGVIKFKQGDLIHVTDGPHTGLRGSIRLTDGAEALVVSENVEAVVSLSNVTYVGHLKP